jgi:hypothetical protein
MAIASNLDSYSADVSLEIVVQGETIDVAKIGPHRLVLRQPRKLPAGAAELRVTVGENTTSQQIILSPRADAVSAEVNYW